MRDQTKEAKDIWKQMLNCDLECLGLGGRRFLWAGRYMKRIFLRKRKRLCASLYWKERVRYNTSQVWGRMARRPRAPARAQRAASSIRRRSLRKAQYGMNTG